MPAFYGETTIPTVLQKRQMLILGMDRAHEAVIAPLLAGVLHILLMKQVASSRSSPLVVFLDELPSLYLPDLPKWINTFRESGIGFVLGVQSLAQIDRIYGPQARREIFGACASKVMFNPQDEETARAFSQYLGDRDVDDWQVSRSWGKSGASTSRTHVHRTRPLLAPYEMLKLATGEGIFINPNFQDGGEHYVPLRQKLRLEAVNGQLGAVSRELWSDLRERLTKHVGQQEIGELDLELRWQEAEKIMPENI